LDFGKWIRGDCYFHVSVLPQLSAAMADLVDKAVWLTEKQIYQDFNVIKIHRSGGTVSLLSYLDFYDDPFPCLGLACTVDVTKGVYRDKTYSQLGNPPILHRKELLISKEDSRYDLFKGLSDNLEMRGIYSNKPGLGFKNRWSEHLQLHNVKMDGHTMVTASDK